MKAADITEEAMLAAIRRDTAERGIPAWTQTMAVREGWPWKVALAKLRRMKWRGLIDGCECGCRGDWTIQRKKEVS